MPYNADWWFCSAARECAAQEMVMSAVESLDPCVPRLEYDSSWLMEGGKVDSSRYDHWILMLRLELVEVPVDEVTTIEVYCPDVFWWNDVIADVDAAATSECASEAYLDKLR